MICHCVAVFCFGFALFGDLLIVKFKLRQLMLPSSLPLDVNFGEIKLSCSSSCAR